LWHAAGIVITSLSATMLPMSLGVLSWSSFAYAFMYLWGLLLLAALLFGLGLHHGLDTPIIVAAFCLATFCLATLLMFGVPGDVDALVISMPDGSTLNISLSS
jgi:phage shock protein C